MPRKFKNCFFRGMNGLRLICLCIRGRHRLEDRLQVLSLLRRLEQELSECTLLLCRGRNHSHFYRIRKNIRNNGIYLFLQEFWFNFHNSKNACRILCGQSGNRAHCVNFIAGNRLNIRLNSRSTTRIAACNRQCCFNDSSLPDSVRNVNRI